MKEISVRSHAELSKMDLRVLGNGNSRTTMVEWCGVFLLHRISYSVVGMAFIDGQSGTSEISPSHN
jgi:hypothetical protein